MYLNQLIGRKLAHVHSSERKDVTQSPPSNDIEMSTIVNSKIVHNDPEGQTKSFKDICHLGMGIIRSR